MDAKTRYKAKKIKIVFLILTIPYEMLRPAMFRLRSPEYSLNYEKKEFTQPLLVEEGFLEFQKKSRLSNPISMSL